MHLITGIRFSIELNSDLNENSSEQIITAKEKERREGNFSRIRVYAKTTRWQERKEKKREKENETLLWVFHLGGESLGRFFKFDTFLVILLITSFHGWPFGWIAGERAKRKRVEGKERCGRWKRGENEREHTCSYDARNATEAANKFPVTLRSYLHLRRRCCTRVGVPQQRTHARPTSSPNVDYSRGNPEKSFQLFYPNDRKKKIERKRNVNL